MNEKKYIGMVFAERYNSFFGLRADWYSKPKIITDSTSQRDVLSQWEVADSYTDAVRSAQRKLGAAKILFEEDSDTYKNYVSLLVQAKQNYHTYLDNLEIGGNYDFAGYREFIE